MNRIALKYKRTSIHILPKAKNHGKDRGKELWAHHTGSSRG